MVYLESIFKVLCYNCLIGAKKNCDSARNPCTFLRTLQWYQPCRVHFCAIQNTSSLCYGYRKVFCNPSTLPDEGWQSCSSKDTGLVKPELKSKVGHRWTKSWLVQQGMVDIQFTYGQADGSTWVQPECQIFSIFNFWPGNASEDCST